MSSPIFGESTPGAKPPPFEISSFVLVSPVREYIRFVFPGVITGYLHGDESLPVEKVLRRHGIGPQRGLFDTWATHTTISSRLASLLELPVVDEVKVSTANGVHTCNLHAVNIALPNNTVFYGRFAASGDLGDVDFLLGMDIISLGDISMIRKGNHLVLTFTMYHTHSK